MFKKAEIRKITAVITSDVA